jgi:cytoskeletal protein CcmA (bactofilin family)
LSEGGKSIISNDLKIIGQGLKIISRGVLQVDGEVEGDVAGAEVIIGDQGKVTGTVAAERVIVRGRTSGLIRAMTVALQASARVEGDIHHMSLTIRQGAFTQVPAAEPQNQVVWTRVREAEADAWPTRVSVVRYSVEIARPR